MAETDRNIALPPDLLSGKVAIVTEDRAALDERLALRLAVSRSRRGRQLHQQRSGGLSRSTNRRATAEPKHWRSAPMLPM